MPAVQADVNVLDILELKPKRAAAQKEIQFHNELFRIIDKGEPEAAGDFEQQLKIHVAENYPTMLEILDKNNSQFPGGPPMMRPKAEIFTEDQLDEFYGNSGKPYDPASANKERIRPMAANNEPDVPLAYDFAEDRMLINGEHAMLPNGDMNGAMNGAMKKSKRGQMTPQGYEQAVERSPDHLLANGGYEIDDVNRLNFSPQMKSNGGVQKDSFDQERFNELQVENDELQDTILQLEEEKRRLETNLKRSTRASNQKPKRSNNELTFLNEYELKTLSNPSNMDLMRILNDQELSYKKLEKNYNTLERSYHELFEADRVDQAIRSTYIDSDPQLYSNGNVSRSINNGHFDTNMRSSEVRRKLANERVGNTFVGELKDDISRILNKRRSNQII